VSPLSSFLLSTSELTLSFPPLAVQKQLLNRSDSISLGRSKSVYQQRNLGTIRARKIEKKQSTSSTSGEMILRVLRLQ
jgi:hypothetical protein